MNELPKDNFKKEAKLNLWLFVGIVAAGILAAWLIPYLSEFIAVDKCLDAGGSFNYQTGECIGSGTELGK